MSSQTVPAPPWTLTAMRFAERLVTLRKQKGLTQQALSDLTGIHLTQIRRYEGGATQPTFEMLRKLAVALSVSADVLLFDEDERGPTDDLRLQFEAAGHLDPEERRLLKELIEGILLRHEAKRWTAASSAAARAAS
jgi:transcriptional regulator with XRE-family HTH domain